MTEPTLLPDERGPEEGSLTIGAVCDLLRAEHPTISISKIRYLEDQKLITPRRTPGGYRLYSPRDVERLRTILRLQRDEFLPLRVIRQELESSSSGAFSVAEQAKKMKRAQLTGPAPTRRYSASEVMEATGAAATPACSKVAATRNARSSRHGGAMTWTASGSSGAPPTSTRTGTATTGRSV